MLSHPVATVGPSALPIGVRRVRRSRALPLPHLRRPARPPAAGTCPAGPRRLRLAARLRRRRARPAPGPQVRQPPGGRAAARAGHGSRSSIHQVDVVTWVPTTARRRRQRGYDQARLLARRSPGRWARRVRGSCAARSGPAQTGRTLTQRHVGPRSRRPAPGAAAPSWWSTTCSPPARRWRRPRPTLRDAGRRRCDGVTAAATPLKVRLRGRSTNWINDPSSRQRGPRHAGHRSFRCSARSRRSTAERSGDARADEPADDFDARSRGAARPGSSSTSAESPAIRDRPPRGGPAAARDRRAALRRGPRPAHGRPPRVRPPALSADVGSGHARRSHSPTMRRRRVAEVRE